MIKNYFHMIFFYKISWLTRNPQLKLNQKHISVRPCQHNAQGNHKYGNTSLFTKYQATNLLKAHDCKIAALRDLHDIFYPKKINYHILGMQL